MIYIDPPYNTGDDGFIYPDKFEFDDETLKDMFGMNDKEFERLKSIQGTATHSAWLTFMYPRLWLAKRLLKENGVILLSIDDNEQANLTLLLNEIFGEGNKLPPFTWQNKKVEVMIQHMLRKKLKLFLFMQRTLILFQNYLSLITRSM